MLKRTLIAFALTTVMLAAAEVHKITLHQESIAGSEQLAPGNYKLKLDGEKAVLSKGKNSVNIPVKVETLENTNPSTTVRFVNADGKYRIQEIRLGGTNKRLVFDM